MQTKEREISLIDKHLFVARCTEKAKNMAKERKFNPIKSSSVSHLKILHSYYNHRMAQRRRESEEKKNSSDLQTILH
jgi:hypothetical protein